MCRTGLRSLSGTPRRRPGRRAEAGSWTRAIRTVHRHERGVSATLTVRGSESVPDTALRVGVHVPYSCREGICGTCRAKVICGDVHHDPSDLEPAEVAEGFALACHTRPAGHGVTLDFDHG
ncbi:2Fe-2S iron-sulfur cluster-binding protein [Streptomyces sp. NBC_01310]|uniref:2Fe-2S iron-sulfur cluster-binding protein n=1 Tax=Streptomyces sp. NBC_01310 TaxID=2903820 RepID=UPI0035B64EDF